MLVNIHGAKCVGIEAVSVTIEIEIQLGIGLHLVGLADAAVKESLLRTVTALQARGFHIPGKKIVINLAPADMHKQGSGYDLPIALGIIAASGQRPMAELEKYLIMGELGLDAGVRPVSGALPMVELAQKMGLRGCILPEESALEAVDYTDSLLFGVRTLDDVLRILAGEEDVSDLLIWNTETYARAVREQPEHPASYMDFADIIGQNGAKRGVEIACSGGHNVLLIGAPGSGKSSIAKAMAGILPPMTREESAITSKVYSVAGRASGGVGLMRSRPFRAPHISASKAAMLGGGSGENILPEYPASFMLVAASNPCPCGYYGEGDRCTCTVGQRLGYLSKLSGPIMDRIDIQIWVHPVETSALVRGGKAEPSEAIAARVLKAREIQRERFRGSGIFTNAEMSSKQLEAFCPLDEECKQLLERLIDKLGLSARAYTRIIKIARTIADLSGSADIHPEHLAEAASYRFLDRRNILE